jgi:hypothetical protein
MTKLIGKRISPLLLASALIGLMFISASRRAAAQGGFGYMCDAWEESCDDGSGDFGGGSGGSGSGGGKWMCPAPPQPNEPPNPCRSNFMYFPVSCTFPSGGGNPQYAFPANAGCSVMNCFYAT